MHKLVYTVFKTIFLSMMFIFLFDMVFYLYRAFSVNQRMESIMTSMQKVVIENNYLPEGAYNMYVSIFKQLAKDMNGGDTFIVGFDINYKQDAKGSILPSLQANTTTGGTRDLLVKQMSKPAQYGDVMIVQSRVGITQPIWNFGTASHEINNAGALEDYHFAGNQGGDDSTNWNRVGYRVTTFTYTYYVPCLKYQSIKDV